MIAADDSELWTWLNQANTYGGDFLKALSEAGLRADPMNYALLRAVLLLMKSKYPKYADPAFPSPPSAAQ